MICSNELAINTFPSLLEEVRERLPKNSRVHGLSINPPWVSVDYSEPRSELIKKTQMIGIDLYEVEIYIRETQEQAARRIYPR